MKLGPSISPEKCCDFKTKKINFAEHRGKIIVMFINLMDYASKAGNPVRTGDTGRKTARYLKRLSTITKNSFKNVEVWYVRAQSMLPGESIASYEFMTNCLFTKNETTTGTKGDVCFDKFLIFSNTNAGKFKGNNAGLKHWISKYCPGSNLVDLDKYTEKVPVESHTWPITCIIDRNGFSRLANDDYQSPELLFNRILKFEGDNQYELKPISNLNLRKEGQSSFIEWAKE